MNKAEEDSAPYFKMDRTKFDYIDAGYENRVIDQQLSMSDEERFFAMETLRITGLNNPNDKMDRTYFEIRK